MSVTDEQLERALNYLATTDEAFAKAKAEVERADGLRKRIRSRVYLLSVGTVAERNALAEVHEDTIKADQDYYDRALVDFETLKAKRDTHAREIEVWRTVSSNRRAGMSV